MPRAEYLVAAGFTVRDAEALLGTVDGAVSAAGSDQAGATLLTADHSLVTTISAGQGVRLPSMTVRDSMSVANGHATEALLVYPPSGWAINGAAANGPMSLPPRKGAAFKCVGATDLMAIYS
jgi:hypothetical protein